MTASESGVQRNAALVQWIRQFLLQGIPVTAPVRAFMRATFGGCDLAGIFATAEACERDTLLELLFFPDTALCLQYEHAWGDQVFAEADLEAIVDALTADGLRTSIDSEPPNTPYVCEVPSFIWRTFLQRLNITWRAPAALRRAIDNLRDRRWAATIIMQLRRARLVWHPGQIDMVLAWVARAADYTSQAHEELPWLLVLLPELKPQQSASDFLLAKKAFFFEALCRAEAFEQRSREPMELLMVQGYRAGCGSVAEWRAQMARIDRLSLRLFGRTTFFQRSAEQWVDLPVGRGPSM